MLNLGAPHPQPAMVAVAAPISKRGHVRIACTRSSFRYVSHEYSSLPRSTVDY